MRYGWSILASILFSTQSLAGVEQELQQCATINDKLERLICYDKLAARPSTAVNSVPSADTFGQSKSKVEAQKDDFGQTKPKKDALERVELTIKKIKKHPYGNLIITFENGQVWKQTSVGKYRLKVGNKVFIKKGALGSFLLGTADRNTTIRVKRTK
ncbi:hypothetical protein D5R81_11090 [Parashewanella spongiae]|uniref:Type IV pilus biogenesis protein PilP n=1 Tax=Parashewanella spongiae TaxID=342950 RepID=A0A3A6U0V9_9GAMM|nr:hypothetical protein [Parashewanella spongiae]MCL1078468.1 hypothetical protein [Parashewanella spongiae]RJY14611.1 hypothetical protein D5R81_11090 [Parashewanella spongiae]